MEEATQAFVFFWLAGLFVLAGTMLGLFSKSDGQRKLGSGMAVAGLLSLMATPWTLPFSPSSAFGHLLGSLVGRVFCWALASTSSPSRETCPWGNFPERIEKQVW